MATKKHEDTTVTSEATTTDVAVVTEPATALAVVSDDDLMAEDFDTTNDFGSDDLAVPFLRILQANSPAAVKRGEEYVPGAEPGHFLNTVTKQVYSGEDGVIIVPVAYHKNLTAWKPRAQDGSGGGFVHDYGTDMSALTQAERNEKNKMIDRDGNELVESGNYYVLVVNPDGSFNEALLSLSSTQLKYSRQWNSIINGLLIKHPTTGKMARPAMFYMSYNITTKVEKKGENQWFVVNIHQGTRTADLDNGMDIYLAAKNFREIISSGKVKVVDDRPASSGNPDDEGGDIPF